MTRIIAIALTFLGVSFGAANAAELRGAQASAWAKGLLGISLPNNIVSLGPLTCWGQPPKGKIWWDTCVYGNERTARFAGVFWRAPGVPASKTYEWVYKSMGGTSGYKFLDCTNPARLFVGGAEAERQDCRVSVRGWPFPVSFVNMDFAGNGVTLYVRNASNVASSNEHDLNELLAGVSIPGRLARQ